LKKMWGMSLLLLSSSVIDVCVTDIQDWLSHMQSLWVLQEAWQNPSQFLGIDNLFSVTSFNSHWLPELQLHILQLLAPSKLVDSWFHFIVPIRCMKAHHPLLTTVEIWFL
jgi:hypothetical protein